MLQSIISNRPIIHLSFFTGIGVSQLALHYLHTNIATTFSWEIDPFCNELLDHHYHQNIQHMGDIADTDFTTFCQGLAAHYDTTHIILITAAPPCKDHSRVRDTPPGLSGDDGSLLQQMTNIDLTIRQNLPQYTVRSLMENVLPHPTIRSQFDDISRQLGYKPLIVDAADGHITSRPRLWWLDADWTHITQHLTHETPWTIHWTQHDDYDKLHNPLAPLIQPPVHVRDWETPAILCQQQLFHCLTTQAPTDLGRPPPQHAKADNSTWDRWQQDNRQFPPWQYQPQFLTRKHEGDWQPITPLQRERIMALPDHYTSITEQHPSTRSRNTMLGNAWHFPSALWLITLLLILPTTATIPHPPTCSNIQKLTAIWIASKTLWGPPPRSANHQHMPQLDWNSHLRWAKTIQEPTADQTQLDPSLCWAIDQSHQLPNIHDIRLGVITELNALVTDLHEQTQQWFDQIPPHCQRAYKQSNMVTQIPALIHILQQLHYPHTTQLQAELSHGFQLIGALHPGLNWHVRTDQKYTAPTSLDELRQHNREYIHKKLQQQRVDPHWRLMADEIAKEVQQGRMAGPFHGPQWLQHSTTPLLEFEHTSTLQPLPHTDPIIAMAFSIEQTGSDGKAKIRRGEDWRRSGHNQACQMTDQPYHHTPDHYTWLAQYTCRSSQEVPLVWGHDHDGAYRQLPLDDPSIAYVLLLTPSGPTLWHHHVLLFGSAASVWAYNRFGDMLSAIARTITCIPVVHYVDDYGSIEPTRTAQSGFSTFERLNSILGFHMKKSKRQPPEPSHRIQGVLISCDAENITISPCQDRVEHISTQLQTHLQTKAMTPEQARKLAGKCSFTTTHLFGRVGRAALSALYDKAFSNNDTLSSHTQSAIIALIDILNNCQPRRLPLRPTPTQHTIIYTDAFYREGDKQCRCSELLQQTETFSPSPSMTNGWAAVIFHPSSSRPLVFNGTVPPKLLKHFASNKAFIYFLEAWAAIITPILVKPLLTPTYIQLCDNDAATHAIIKGSGSHAPLNNLLGSHWTWHNRHCLRQILRRVPTHANIADPFSREDFTIARQLQWPILEPPTSRLLETTKKIIGDSRFAHQIGFTQDPYILQFQSLAHQKMFPTSNTEQTTSWIQAMRIMIKSHSRRPIPWTWVQETKFARSTSTGMDRRRVKSYHTLRSQWPCFTFRRPKVLNMSSTRNPKLRILFTARRIQHLLQTRPRAKNPTHILVWRKKVRRLPVTLLMIKLWTLKWHLMWLLVSTYLFVRCNNHKSVWHLCEEVSWLSPEMKLIYLCLRRCLNYSWLILVQVPLYLEICIPFFFSPLPPSPLILFHSFPNIISLTHLIHIDTHMTHHFEGNTFSFSD